MDTVYEKSATIIGLYTVWSHIGEPMRTEPRQRMQEAEDLLEEWISNAVEEAQKEVFGEDSRLDSQDLRRINKVDKALRERDSDGGGLWGSVHYRIYTKETEDGDEVVSIDTFGVPMIPSDLDSLEVDESERRTYNDVLSDYGVKVSQKVEEQFKDWRSERREQA